jgi:GAF domain-containing protein
LIGEASEDEDPTTTVVRSTARLEHEIDHRINSMVVGWIEHHKKPLLSDDILETLNIKNPSPDLQRLGSALAVPLVADDKVVGVINLVNSRGGALFSQDSLRIVNLLAPLAARFIVKAKTQESLFKANERLNAALRQHPGTDHP